MLALGISAFQPKLLSDWAQGGIVAIHGTNEPWLIGQAVSHGCVRMKRQGRPRGQQARPGRQPVFIQK